LERGLQPPRENNSEILLLFELLWLGFATAALQHFRFIHRLLESSLDKRIYGFYC
jgi:hypothetical protein